MRDDTQEGTVRELQRLIGELRRETGADGAAFLTFAMHDDRVVTTKVLRSGQFSNWGLLSGGEPPEGFDHDESDAAIAMRRDQWCLRAPVKRHFNTFCWLRDDVAQRAPWERTPAYDGLYLTNDFTSQLRATFYQNGVVTGWFGLFWRDLPDQARDRAQQLAEAHASDLQDLAQRNADIAVESHRILLRDGDEVLAASPTALEAFETDELRRLGRKARRKAMTHRSRWCYGRWGVDYIPMSGDAGNAHLVLLEPLRPVTIDMRCALTSLQTQVANLVAEGATNGEAAQKLDVSHNTIKYHLKNIYTIVGVSNRVELASFLVR